MCRALLRPSKSRFKKRAANVINPWYFPTEEEYKSLLESLGFNVERITLYSRYTQLPGSVREWVKTFGQALFHNLPQEEHAAFLDDVEADLSDQLKDESGIWHADYMRLRVIARKA